ncbi:MAG: hypothetical protein JRJ49_08120 [Deltaproteobacteria bacterium]|nr:hypothetical protein [Deltaproteobacteria bacterium]
MKTKGANKGISPRFTRRNDKQKQRSAKKQGGNNKGVSPFGRDDSPRLLSVILT